LKRFSLTAFVLGLATTTGLVAWQGFATVAASMALVGWGLLVMSAWYLVPLLGMAAAWRLLLPAAYRPAMSRIVRASWIGLAVNWLLPVAAVGGELVKAMIINREGVAGPVAGASVLADKLAQAVSQLLWGLLGIVLLLQIQAGGGLAPTLLGVTGLFGLLVFLFYRVQSGGLVTWLLRHAGGRGKGRAWQGLIGGAERLDAALIEIYRHPARIAGACALRLGARMAIAAEVWLALHLMGYPIGVVEAMMLESLSAAIRTATFAVPAGLGAQEGAFLLFGHVLGVGPEAALAVSLLKRVRELMVGLPALVAWQLSESRRLLFRPGVD
jgi:putative membrane protein